MEASVFRFSSLSFDINIIAGNFLALLIALCIVRERVPVSHLLHCSMDRWWFCPWRYIFIAGGDQISLGQ